MQTAAVTTTTAWRWQATGTTWQIHHTGGVDEALAGWAAEAVARDEARWSRFVATSEVSRVTASAGSPVPVDADTLDLVEAACRWQRVTGGLFNPLVGRALAAWGYAESLSTRPAGLAASPQASAVEGEPVVDRAAGTVAIPVGTALDLGGIGKAWIAARVAALVRSSCDDPQLLVDAGGDMTAARGDHRVTVERPGDPDGEPLARVLLREGTGVATSGDSRRHWRNGDGGRAHHLIDPATGAPGAPAHATVVADDVVAADVLAKVLALRPQLIVQLAEPAIVITDGCVDATPAWSEVCAS
ncbi:MAG TPA: FAD:protein FMN transferase [Gaiellales bacterium]|nr:FAD:protein FMN transferase [Gaiellales bacterium]